MASSECGFIYTHGEANLATLRDLLNSGPHWAYVAHLVAARLVACNSDLPITWPQGRAFGANVSRFDPEFPVGLEVRWKQVGGEHYHVDVLTEDPAWQPTGDGWRRNASEVDGIRLRPVLLWGEMNKDPRAPLEWIEVRVPQALKYPVSKVEYPTNMANQALLRVVVYSYDYTVGGVPVATRWAWLDQDRRKLMIPSREE